jgi:preprotein translocase subunit SecY
MSDGKKTNKKTSTTLKEIFTNKTVLAALAITVFLLIVFHMLSILTTPGIHISGSD